jgi:cell division protein FtsW (lipid II flippase)
MMLIITYLLQLVPYPKVKSVYQAVIIPVSDDEVHVSSEWYAVGNVSMQMSEFADFVTE